MDSEVKSEFYRLRNKNMIAVDAMKAAKTNISFRHLEQRGLVKFDVKSEIDFYDDSYIDAMNVSDAEKQSLRDKINKRIEKDGLWIIISYYRMAISRTWIVADSIGGFIGSEFIDSGYDSTVKEKAINNYYHSVLLDAFGPLGIINQSSSEVNINLSINQKFAIMSEFISHNCESLVEYENFVKKIISTFR